VLGVIEPSVGIGSYGDDGDGGDCRGDGVGIGP
jgi:hypothetical protein